MVKLHSPALVVAASLLGVVAAHTAQARAAPGATAAPVGPLAPVIVSGAPQTLASLTELAELTQLAHQGATAAAAPVLPLAPLAPAVAGRVLSGASALARVAPLGSAGVYAYQLADFSLRKVSTDAQGNFSFRDLPAGLYKIIAHKPGFVPAVILLTRTTAQAYQFLELQLAQQDAAHRSQSADDFWALRARIPADVLRDIETAELPGLQGGGARGAPPAGGPTGVTGSAQAKKEAASLSALARTTFHTEMQAMTGVTDVAQLGSGAVSDAKLGIEGRVGDVQVGLKGRFWQMNGDLLGQRAGGAAGSGWSNSRYDGQTSALSLVLQPGPSSRISVTSLNNRLVPRGPAGATAEPGDLPNRHVGLEHYQVSWSQALGENSRSDFAAQYTSEFNYHRQSLIDPADIPGASRTWNVEGAYTTSMTDNSTLQAGLRFRQQQFGLGANALMSAAQAVQAGTPGTSLVASPALSPGHTDVDLFSRGGTRIAPAILVEYGLYSTLLDGSLTLTPQGGVVLQLGDGWQARGSLSRQAYQQAGLNPEFLPTLFKETDLCQQGSKSCYELNLSRRGGNDELISLSAVERVVSKTLRLYFNDEIFDRLESLYLVPGDRLPELRLVVTRRLLPRVVTTLESSIAAGGGGTFVAADGLPFRNRVRYLVTSLDTRFQSTSTGVFVALHHISQSLAPAAAISSRASERGTVPAASALPASATQTDRLQVVLTQDLNVLFNLANAWALRLNMEVSRGDANFFTGLDNQLHHRILGGIAVRF